MNIFEMYETICHMLDDVAADDTASSTKQKPTTDDEYIGVGATR